MNPIAKSRTYRMVLCALFAALIAVGAFIRIPVPLVPFTLQTFFVSLAGMLLGRKLGALSALLYLFIGLVGLPVFTQGGGISYVLKPSFGYLIGFVLGAFVTGAIARKTDKPSFARLLCAALAGLAVIYTLGSVYFYFLSNYYLGSPVGVWTALLYCFVVFIPGDGAMSVVAALVAKRMIPILEKNNL
ncbi:MAG TPA: biotin transporter BioY [Eubacteriales bacterium]|nr:biotin transporter BioY [Eubacteriales bacterium]